MSNTAKSPTNAGSNWWNAATFGPDCEAYCDLPSILAASAALKTLYARLQGGVGTSTVDGYRTNYKTSDDSWIIARIDNGACTQLGAMAAGDSFGLGAIGSNIASYRKTGGAWSQILTSVNLALRADAADIHHVGRLIDRKHVPKRTHSGGPKSSHVSHFV